MAFDKINRRRYVAGLASVTGLAGCLGGSGGGGGGGGGSGKWVRDVPQKQGPIKYPNLGDMSGDPATKKVIQQFEEKTKHTVEPRIINPDSLLGYARSRLQSQTSSIDAFTIYASILWPLATQGYFEPVGDHINDEYVNAWADSVKEAYRLPHSYMNDFPYGESIYATPFYDDMWMPFVNMRVLEEVGVNPEKEIQTFQQFLDIAATVKEQDAAEYPVIFPYSSPGEGGNIFMDIVARSGGRFIKNGKPQFTSDAVREAADFFMTLFKRNLAPQGVTSLSEGNATQQFFSGKGAFMFNASSNIFLPGKELPIKKDAAEIARITSYPKPQGAGDTPTLNATPTGLALSVFSPNKEATVEFMNYMGSPKAQKIQLVTEGNVGLVPKIYDDPKVKEQVPYSQVLKRNLEGSTVLKYPNSAEMRNMVYSTVQKAIASGWSGKELTQRLQQEAKKLVQA